MNNQITLVAMGRTCSLALAFLIATGGTIEGRVFTNTEGKSLEAEIVRASTTKVTLRLKNKRTSTIPLTKLSEEDRKFVAAWLADKVPHLRFKPNLVRSNRDERDSGYYSSDQIQTFEMTVDYSNDENTKGLEESLMKFILVGRSMRDKNQYKILSVQNETFTVAPSGRGTIPFRKVINRYYDGSYSKSGYKCTGYIVHAERKRDKREVFSYASTKPLEELLHTVLKLKTGDVTDKFFRKVNVVGKGIRDDPNGPIIVR